MTFCTRVDSKSTIGWRLPTGCDQRPIGATPAVVCPRKEMPYPRSANGPGGPVTCTVIAFRWRRPTESIAGGRRLLERLYVSVSPRGDVSDVGRRYDQRRRGRARLTALCERSSADRATARYVLELSDTSSAPRRPELTLASATRPSRTSRARAWRGACSSGSACPRRRPSRSGPRPRGRSGAASGRRDPDCPRRPRSPRRRAHRARPPASRR